MHASSCNEWISFSWCYWGSVTTNGVLLRLWHCQLHGESILKLNPSLLTNVHNRWPLIRNKAQTAIWHPLHCQWYFLHHLHSHWHPSLFHLWPLQVLFHHRQLVMLPLIGEVHWDMLVPCSLFPGHLYHLTVNAWIHGMTTVSPASITYIATQVSVHLSNWATTHRSSTGSFCIKLLSSVL